jgi:glutamyl-tRNA synthetase
MRVSGTAADLITRATPLVQERMSTLREAREMLQFLIVGDDFTIDPESAAKQFGDGTREVLDASVTALTGLAEFDHDRIEAALRSALVDGLGLKPRNAFGPVRVAVTGSTVSPPLFESIELLGRDLTVSRLQAALSSL